jgi:hypothetical protein
MVWERVPPWYCRLQSHSGWMDVAQSSVHSSSSSSNSSHNNNERTTTTRTTTSPSIPSYLSSYFYFLGSGAKGGCAVCWISFAIHSSSSSSVRGAQSHPHTHTHTHTAYTPEHHFILLSPPLSSSSSPFYFSRRHHHHAPTPCVHPILHPLQGLLTDSFPLAGSSCPTILRVSRPTSNSNNNNNHVRASRPHLSPPARVIARGVIAQRRLSSRIYVRVEPSLIP